MKKILIVFDSYRGGAGNIAQILAFNLRNQGYSVSLLLTNNSSKPRYDLSNISAKEIRPFVGKSKILRFFRSFGIVRKAIENVHPDLVVSFLDVNNVLSCFASNKLKIPVIVCERSNPLIIKPDLRWVFLRRIAYKKADVVTVQFEAFKKFDKGRYFHHCIAISNFVNQPNVFKTKYSLVSDKSFRLVALGRLHPIKNYSSMLRILLLLQKKGIDAVLDICGDGKEKNKLEDYASKLGIKEKVNFCGHVEDPYPFLEKHDVYVITSKQEGFPNALVEAMAVGLPCVAFRCHDGFKDIINDSDNGFLVKHNDEIEFANCLEKLYYDEKIRSQIGNKAKDIVNKFSADKIIAKWNSIISTIFQK